MAEFRRSAPQPEGDGICVTRVAKFFGHNRRLLGAEFVVATDSPSSLKTVWHPAFFKAASCKAGSEAGNGTTRSFEDPVENVIRTLRADALTFGHLLHQRTDAAEKLAA